MDVGQVRPREGVVEVDGADAPADDGHDDQRLEYQVSARVDERGQRDCPQQVRHDRDDEVVEQVRRADELCRGVGGGRHVAVYTVL